MKRKDISTAQGESIRRITSVNIPQSSGKISINYYFTIVVLVVVMINLILMLYYKPS